MSTTPAASIRAKHVVGPTNRQPCAFSALASARDSSEAEGTCATVSGRGVAAGWCAQTLSLIHI